VDDAALLRSQGSVGCSAWSACPGDWTGWNPAAPLPWLVVIGFAVAFASPIIKRSWWPAAYAAASAVLLAVTALRMYAVPYGYEESNYTLSVPPTPWFAVMLAALAAIAVGPRRQPERDE
jgi:peptidoglycan/LPS O-acetylase OafA/YrhL